MEKRTLFIKPGRPIDGEVKLDPNLISNNKSNKIETTIVLDTNILIGINNVVNKGNKWRTIKECGLHNLIKLLQRCPPKSVALSPGLAFEEMPPGLAEESKEKYERFCSEFLPSFIKAPNSIDSKYKGKKKDYGFEDLSRDAKRVLAVPFASLLYLNLIDYTYTDKPINKFVAYLDIIEQNIDILSATEIEIAKYCFAESPSNASDVIDLRKKIRKNFLKTSQGKLPKSSSEVLDVAFNGACDIRLLHAANVMDQNGLDDVKQDSWIATKDKKLEEFCNIFHHVSTCGEVGEYAATTISTGHADDPYWILVDTEIMNRGMARYSYHKSREIDADKLVDIAELAIKKIRDSYC